MAGELVERLRKVSRVLQEYGWGSEMVSPPDEAADRIEALERENATLRAERAILIEEAATIARNFGTGTRTGEAIAAAIRNMGGGENG